MNHHQSHQFYPLCQPGRHAWVKEGDSLDAHGKVEPLLSLRDPLDALLLLADGGEGRNEEEVGGRGGFGAVGVLGHRAAALFQLLLLGLGGGAQSGGEHDGDGVRRLVAVQGTGCGYC